MSAVIYRRLCKNRRGHWACRNAQVELAGAAQKVRIHCSDNMAPAHLVERGYLQFRARTIAKGLAVSSNPVNACDGCEL